MGGHGVYVCVCVFVCVVLPGDDVLCSVSITARPMSPSLACSSESRNTFAG